MLEVIPAILTNDPKELEEKIRAVEGLVKRAQIDVVDGVFAKSHTVDLSAVASLETDLLLDIHLMTKEPVLWVERAIRAMADRVIGQVEMMSDQTEFIGKVTEAGLKVGLAIDLPTLVVNIDPAIMLDLDVVLVMSVKAGFGGQEFDHRALEKVRELDEIRARDDTPFRICVDGGINKQHIKEVRQAGADEVAIGARIFSGDLRAHLEELIEAAYAG